MTLMMFGIIVKVYSISFMLESKLESNLFSLFASADMSTFL